MFFSHGTNHSKGVMILINPSLECKIEKCITDKNGRLIILKLSFDEQSIVLVKIYAPNDVQQQLKFFSTLNQLLQEFAEEKILIAGDFNCALSPKDKIGGKSVTRKASVIKQIETLCASHNLRDIWRNINPELSRFTWRNKSLKIQCRLDYFLISEKLCNLTKTCDILLAPESDHSAISIHIQSDSSAQKKGPGFWKFNTALLEDESYTAALRENILTFKAKYADLTDSGLKWDLIKMEIRGFTVKYSKRKAKRTRHGHASTFFPLQRGVRQGCPLSGILFVLGIELFARALKNKTSIKGIEVDNHEIKVAQYADDTTVFVRDRESVHELLDFLKEFSAHSGLEINTAKTEAMWLGQWKNNQDTPFGFKWPKEPILSLGIFFSHNQAAAEELNFGAKIRDLEKTLIIWQKRKLTLYGKINIVKTLGLSKLIFNASFLHMPDHFIEQINKITFNFIWDGKPKIKRTTIIGEKKDGGLRMCDFSIMDKALKIAWINRIQTQSSAAWKIIPDYFSRLNGNLAFLTNCSYETRMLKLHDLPDFYRSILEYCTVIFKELF